MKKPLFFILVVFFVLKGTAQDAEANIFLPAQSLTLAELIALLEADRGLSFSYSTNIIDLDHQLNLRPNPYQLEELLQEAGKQAGFTFLQRENRILLKKVSSGNIVKVQGKLVDEENNAVPFATIYLKDTQKGTFSNESGKFSLENIDTGEKNILIISSVGYISRSIEIDNKMGEETQTIVLMPSFRELAPVEVTTGSYQLQEAISPTSSLSKKQIDYSPNLIKDVFRTIKLIPAVSNTDFSVRPRIRGGSSDETAIYLDGFELINPYHVEISGGVQGLFNTDYVESIKLYPGVFSAKYTDRLSGVVDMTTSSFFEENEYSFSLDLLNVIGSAKIKLGERWFLSSSVRRGYWDLLVDLESLGAELSFNDAWQKLVFRPNDRHLFELNMLYGKDVFDYRASSQGIVTNFYNSDYDKFYSWMNWKMNINPNLFLRSTLGYQRLTKTADFSFESSFSSDNRDNSAFGMLSLNEYLEYEWNEKHHLSAGMEYRFITNETLFSEDRYNLHASTADEPVIETIAVDADLTEHIGAAFLEHFYQFSNKLHVRNSLRLSGQSFSDRVYLAPRSNVKYHFSRALTGSLGLGLFFQPDFFYDLRSELGQSELRKRNAQAIHYMANLSYGRRNVSIRLDGFYKDYPRLFDDFRFTAPNRIETLATFEQSFEAVSGRSIGLELGVNYQYSSNTLNVNYAYTQNQMTNLAGETVSRSLEIPHSFSVNNLMQFSNGWDISMSFVWRSGLPYSSVIDTEAIEASDRPKRIVFYDINSKNDLRYSAYQSVDLRFSKKWAGDKIAVECYLNVLNFLNSENVRNLHFDTSTQSDGSIDVSPSENIFFPFFITPGIKVSF